MVASFFGTSGNPILADLAKSVTNFLQNPWIHGILFFILVFLFTYFYTAVTFDPKAIATNLQKIGGFVPGIRPGTSTAEFLHKILYRILFLGAIFLGTIAVMPSIVQGATGITAFRFLIGGTALLIVVSVVLDTWRQLKAQMEMREYEKF
jgi:preprotein translocase subunit SecY